MTKHVIPPPQRAQIVDAADRAYEAIRGHVGNSFEVADALRRLAHECWLAGLEHGLKGKPEGGE